MAAEQQMEMEMKGCVRRIKSCTFDLISIGNELLEEDEEDFEQFDVVMSWDLMERELGLKSTSLYCNFTQLGNRLFDSIEEVDNAVETPSIDPTQDRYSQALVVLRDVVALMRWQRLRWRSSPPSCLFLLL